jgi:hypothetical protein
MRRHRGTSGDGVARLVDDSAPTAPKCRLHVADMLVVESLDYLNEGDNVLWRELW